METFTYSPSQLYEGNKVRTTWDAARANLLQFRQEIDNKYITRGYHTPSELQQIAEIDKMINECQKKSNKNFFLGTFMAACLFGVSLYTLLKNT